MTATSVVTARMTPSNVRKLLSLWERRASRERRSVSVMVTKPLRLSLDALRSHKLRSFLTLLGVILAVTTLVAVMSVVAGLNFYVADLIANLGANVFVLNR